MAWDLGRWLEAGHLIRRVYLEELGRDILQDPDALANWLCHLREYGHDEAWLREQFRASDEYTLKHGGAIVLPPAQPPPRPPLEPATARVIKVTDQQDGLLINRGYSYWSQAWIDGGTVVLFAGHADGHPRFFRVHLVSGQVERLGSLLPYTGEAEGWYWDAAGCIYLCDGPLLRRVNPFTGEGRIVFSIAETHPGCDLWQAHSSDDGLVHSATVRRIVNNGAYPKFGTVVYLEGRQDYFAARGVLDESAITPDGTYLVIKEDDDNRIVTLVSGGERRLADRDGAVGHSDCGPGILVGESDKPDPGACVLWDLRKPLTREHRREFFLTWNMGHVSLKGGRCLVSNAQHLLLVNLDGSGVTPLLEHGMVVPPDTPDRKKYDYQANANLDPTGRVACYMSNAAGRMDLYLLVL